MLKHLSRGVASAAAAVPSASVRGTSSGRSRSATTAALLQVNRPSESWSTSPLLPAAGIPAMRWLGTSSHPSTNGEPSSRGDGPTANRVDGGGGHSSTSRRRRRNPGLEAVKQEGMPHLEQTAKDVAAKSQRPLLLFDEDSGPTAVQRKEADRIHRLLDEALDSYSRRDSTFSIRGDPIAIVDCEVSRDLKHARVYWTLPFTLLDLPDGTRREVKRRMQDILDRRGGRLQALVHARLRHYYPPKIRFVPADDDVLSLAMKDLL